MRGSLLDYLVENASRSSDVAFISRPKLRRHVWTFADLARRSFQFARELKSRNVGHGDRILIWAENSPEWVAAFYGTLLRGAIAVPLDDQSSHEFVVSVCEKTSPRLLLTGEKIDSSALDVPYLRLDRLSRIVEHHSGDVYPAENVGPNHTAEIVFTSGTTSIPKGVQLTHENLLTNIAPIEREIEKYIRWEFLIHPLGIMSVLPLSHVFGQMVGVFIPQILKAAVVFQNRLGPSEIIDNIKSERVSVLAAVPRVMETLRNKVEHDAGTAPDDRRRSWPAAWWKFRGVHRKFGLKFFGFVTGGATLDVSVEEFWSKMGFAVVQGYGMTETAALISLNNPFSARRGSLGQILTGPENVRIGEGGEILVRGNNVSAGYWGEKGRGDEEWLDTGDIGSLDEKGRLYFKGRKKETIVTAAGLNIYPEDLEAVLNRQREVTACAVIGIELGSGPEPVAALILRPGSNGAAVVAQTNQILAPFQQIRRWIEWPDADFPRTSTQKIRKTEIAEAVRDKVLGGLPIGNKHSILAAMINRLGRTVSGGVRSDTKLSEDLALDSLSRVELFCAIEERYQLDLDESSLTSATTVGDLERMISDTDSLSASGSQHSYPRWGLRFPVSWIRIAFYYLITLPITLILCRINKRGVENLSEVKGPIIFAANHITDIDAGLIMSALPGRFRRRLAIAMDGERLTGYHHPTAATPVIQRMRLLFQYWLVVGLFNVFPLPRRSGFRASFAFAGEAMDRGYNILIFPEGELTKDGRLQRFHSGVGLLAEGSETDVVPVSITGLYDLKAAGRRRYAPSGSVTITFGPPVRYDPAASTDTITVRLEQAVTDLISPPFDARPCAGNR